MIDELLAGPVDQNLAQVFSLDRRLQVNGFPDHELMVGVDKVRQVGIVSCVDSEHGNLMTQGLPTEPSEPSEIAYYIMQHKTEFPGGSEISIDCTRLAVKEFIASGGALPTCVQWKEMDFSFD